MAVLISKYIEENRRLKEVLSVKDEMIENYTKQITLLDLMAANYRHMVDNLQQQVDLLNELLRREKSKNETLAQGSDQLSSAAAGDSSVEGTVSDSGTSGEGSHT